ncbi:MAG: pyridoxamine 5'-phosphate oxidase family protein [Defluviitaleaceae bacterium]|nr:pyridoxamine 5'-phosphate oxidase family protein [Defluviitaleaceae bacterium]
MTKYEKGMAILEEKFGGGKDNVISLATIALDPAADGSPCPIVRDVDAHYEDGVFYSVTWGESSKMKQIAKNKEVALAVCFEWFNGSGTAENLGWVLEPKNAELRAKLRKTFEKWYEFANNENDKNCCILAVKMTAGVININHHETLYIMDFVNKTAVVHGKDA